MSGMDFWGSFCHSQWYLRAEKWLRAHCSAEETPYIVFSIWYMLSDFFFHLLISALT